MRLDEAREAISRRVIYKASGPEPPESGTIIRCSMSHVFVLYDGKSGVQATCAHDLTLVPEHESGLE